MWPSFAENDPTAAQRFVDSEFHAVERLTDFPYSGRIVPELGDPDIREIIRRPCKIVSRINRENHRVEIAREWHAARGIPDIR
jgi:plasmid stabilization system protein ParE